MIIDISKIDYSSLDRPDILMSLFHPMPEWGTYEAKGTTQDVLIPIKKDIAVGARFHIKEKSAPNVLFFHGNGEIVGDYDQMGPLYNNMGINFLPVDYRGYGRSTGKPTVTSMMQDCHVIFCYVKKWLEGNGYKGLFVVMGRSLGSASVIELVSHYSGQIDGLIVESGFAYTVPLLKILGINVDALGSKEDAGFKNVNKIKGFKKPVLIIHAENDHIIPFSDGQALYDACQSNDKTLIKIPGANHNDIFLKGLPEYMEAVKTFLSPMLPGMP